MAKREVRDKMLQYAHKFYINQISSEYISEGLDGGSGIHYS